MLFGRVLAEDVQAAHHDDPSMVAWIPLRLFASLSLSLSLSITKLSQARLMT